ncbi:PRC-barrel domain-containing protein [Parvularcula oceani]|uniref:PRC-barrel domain-containing protein n=1 Tax=Parvularcula oceani TaxID=1247963 RepID=UPI0004E1A364|nr:PRC-barrel domain-containing protein [Parvularcula oceani]
MAEVHDHSHLRKFSELSGWKLEEGHQDIRNMPLVAPDGASLGRIDDLLVDEGAERVAAVRLEDGRTVAVEPLEIQDDRVIDHGAGHVHAADARTYNAKTVRTA